MIYLRIENIAERTIVIGKLVFEGSISWSDNLSSDLEGEKESGKATKRDSLWK